jgi:hypothetical protein
MAYIKGC